MTQLNELIARFGRSADDPKILGALEDLSKIYSLEAEELYIKWEQYAYQKHKQTVDLDLDTLDAFKQSIQQQMEKKASLIGGQPLSASSSAIKKPKALKPNVSSPSLFGFGMPKTPTLKKRRVEPSLTHQEDNSSPVMASADRSETFFTPSHRPENLKSMTSAAASPLLNNPDPGKVVDVLNLANIDPANGIDFDEGKRVKLIPFFEASKFNFRTMRQNLLDTADVLDEQIENFTQVIQQHYNIPANDIGDPSVQSQSEITAVGRIVPDSPIADGILNTESLALETSRLAGIGRRVQLNLGKVKELTLFPGQIVGLRGKNANGECFVVEEILQIPQLNFPVSTGTELQTYNESMENKPMKVVVVKGPYTPSDSLHFSNLASFIERINTDIRPHVLIMFGPFIDITHPLIASGSIPDFPELKNQPKTLDEVFTKVLAPILKQINPAIQVVLIPSTLDSVSNHAAYPQNMLDRKLLQLPKNFKCYTNPSTFQLNETFVGCSNADAFKDTKEIVKGGNTSLKNRFDRIAEHILTQRRFYPLFPGGIKKRKSHDQSGSVPWEHVTGVDLDVPYMGLTEFAGNVNPDVIIIPSELTHFSRVVQNVLFVNPGSFIRSSGVRGTFAQISITSPNLLEGTLTKVEGDEDIYLHNVWKRCRVDIITA
ncbi:LAME_0F02850g1_1 [Lachancea meyersii CBS 8951]|uniref:DNA polymerase alpha subunit B n=1 Tax=Lachancea meyersii CBS 8951 TaxID=1266667 RepID=A0A1G4JQT0_9SACH|nr:LAME_0F02850g1_1 [Lachancea meyersii CBS 8951]